MTTHTFPEIKHQVTKKVPCRVCGKTLTRSTTLSQTISPFNRAADGEPKTREQILAELKEQAKQWTPLNDVHPGCTSDAEIEAACAAWVKDGDSRTAAV